MRGVEAKFQTFLTSIVGKKIKGKVHPITGHERSRGIALLFL
jgi:hypothetical protein